MTLIHHSFSLIRNTKVPALKVKTPHAKPTTYAIRVNAECISSGPAAALYDRFVVLWSFDLIQCDVIQNDLFVESLVVVSHILLFSSSETLLTSPVLKSPHHRDSHPSIEVC
jgi:hypothetical protein